MTLKLSGVSARHGRIVVCRNVALHVERGEVLVLLGPNGAGKSSTLGAIAGSVASSGEILVDGRALQGCAASRRARMGLSLVPEGRRNLFGALSVAENLQIGVRLLASPQRAAALAQLYSSFPILEQRRAQSAAMLSGGEQQQLAIAVAIARRPSVLLLDEPSQGLAPVALDHLVQIIDSLRAQGLAVLLAEQNHAFAARLGDRFVALRAGEIVARGDRSQLADRELAAVAMMGQSTPAIR